MPDSVYEVVEYCGRLSCRNPIVQTAGRGRRREFCSETCRRAADRDYKRAKALVEVSEMNLQNFRHEVAAYGRKSEVAAGLQTPHDQAKIELEAAAALSRARGILEFSADQDDKYLIELCRLVRAVEPLLGGRTARATA